MPSRNRQNLRSRHIRDEPQRRRHSPHPTLHNLHPRRQTRRTPNRKNHQLRLSQRRRRKNPTVTRQSWPRVCGRAREWRAIRAIPSEPALAHKKTEQFFKPYGHEIHFQRKPKRKTKKRVGQASSPNTTTYPSNASQEAPPAASASASNPSLAEASYAAPNPELSYLSATKHTP